MNQKPSKKNFDLKNNTGKTTEINRSKNVNSDSKNTGILFNKTTPEVRQNVLQKGKIDKIPESSKNNSPEIWNRSKSNLNVESNDPKNQKRPLNDSTRKNSSLKKGLKSNYLEESPEFGKTDS